MRVLFFGDIVGKAGRKAVAEFLPELKKQYSPDLVIANVENAAHGKGVTVSTINFLRDAGIDFFTSGNHIFDKPEAVEVFEGFAGRIIRPANYAGNLPSGDPLPGHGAKLISVKGTPVLMLNLNGQVFMEKQFDLGKVENPFTALDKQLSEHGRVKIKILDFHAEATSEKRAMGLFSDGRLSAVLGTHTHVQTADAQILPQGTGYLTDLGMVGAAQTVIGVKSKSAIARLAAGEENGSKVPLEIDEGEKFEVGFAVLEIDEATGKCQNIESKLILQK